MDGTSSSRRSPSRTFVKIDYLLIFLHRRTIVVEKPMETSHVIFIVEDDNQASSHPTYGSSCDDLV
jgi:hypothetical protein